MGDTLREDNFDDRELELNFFDEPVLDPDPNTIRFESLLEETAVDLVEVVDDVDDLRFFASGFDSFDSFCFLLVGGLCTLVANMLPLVLRLFPVPTLVDPGRSPVMG